MKYARPFILGSLLAMAGIQCWRQKSTTCKLYFKVIQSDPRLSGGSADKLSDSQEKWVRTKAPKKYPGICFDPAKATYAIVWTEEQQSKTNVRPQLESTTDVNGALVGSTTTYITEATIRYITHISVMKIGADGKLQSPPLFVDSAPANSLNSSSSAAGLEHGMKFLGTL